MAPAIVFDATADRAETVANLLTALKEKGDPFHSSMLRKRLCGRSAGSGSAISLLDNLFEAADHVRLLDAAAFWADVTAAVEAATQSDPEYRTHLKAAAEKLHQAREQIHSQTNALARFRATRPEEPRGCVARVAVGRAPGMRRGFGRDVRATRRASTGAIRGTEGEVPPRLADRRRSLLRVVPRPRRRAACRSSRSCGTFGKPARQ